mgnify:CR=1 FL=1
MMLVCTSLSHAGQYKSFQWFLYEERRVKMEAIQRLKEFVVTIGRGSDEVSVEAGVEDEKYNAIL